MLVLAGALLTAGCLALAAGACAYGSLAGVLAGLFGFVLSYGLTLAPTLHLLLAELFSPTARPLGACLATALSFSAGAVVDLSMLSLVDALGWSIVLGLLGCVCLLGGLPVLLLPETCGRGTKHKILARETVASKVFIAGELSKEDKNVVYNLLSGTYTLHLLSENKTETLEARMKSKIESMLESMGLTPTFTDESFIDKKTLRLSDAELELYKNMGYEVRSFPKEGFCSEVDKVTLRAQLTMKQNTLATLRKYEADTTKLEAEIADIQAKLAGAEECARKSTTLGGAFTNGKRKNRRETKKARKHRYRYSRRN
jgi:hypothetical protein